MRHIAIARFGHEGNSFASVTTSLADFQDCEWAVGDEVPARYRGSNTEIGGAIAFLERHQGWQPHFLRAAFATPSGEVRREVFETILGEILAGLATRRWDAVYLGQHGAMQVEGVDHADHEILRRVREVIGNAPLGVSFDLHANVTQAELDLADVLVGYKCHPHTDMAETAEKTLALLFDKIAGKRKPVAVVVPMNGMIPSINARTTDGPMAEVASFARGLAQGAGLLDVSVYQGYAYGDRAVGGASVVVCADGDRALARRSGEVVLGELNRVRERFFVALPDAADGIRQGLAIAREDRGPVAVIDAADHPGAGANADTPEFLRALLAAKPDVPAAFVYFWDPATVARAVEAGVGASIDVALGGRLTADFGPPVRARARVERLTDGRIVHTGPVYHGLTFEYGRTAVLEVEGVKIVVTERCKMVSDPTFFALHGIDLARLGVLAIKAKNQFRAAFTGTFAAMIDVDTPGPAMLDFTRLPFKRVPRTHFPFDRRPG
jgi:microcystin degradation protein MlrC